MLQVLEVLQGPWGRRCWRARGGSRGGRAAAAFPSGQFLLRVVLRPAASGCQQWRQSQSKQRDLISLLVINRYEEEINKRTTAENDFVLLKKVKRWAAYGRRTEHLQRRGQILIELVPH